MSSRDCIFLEASNLGSVLVYAVLKIDKEPEKRKKVTRFKEAAHLFQYLDLVPKDKIVGLAHGYDSLGVEGIFVCFDKTTVQGEALPPRAETYEQDFRQPHAFKEHVLEPTKCAQCGEFEDYFLHKARRGD